MSYTRETCGDHFSPLQKAAIIIQYDNNELSRYLDCNEPGEFMGDNWSCAGCMEQTACNYDSGASIEDFSCEFPIEGYNCEDEELFNHSSIIPDNYLLSIYPNPFNPTTTLSFAIPIDAEVSLSIYNLQGREVSTLIEGNMDAGYHSVVWDAKSHSSGVYFVKMVAGEFVNTQKLMLVK